MSSKPDIAHIRKYLNGELDARAMYELERQAQNDPFLMDVIKGMESDGVNHQANLEALTQMLQQRVQQDKKRVVPFYSYWPAAASILIALGIGGWWLTRQTQKPLIAINTQQAEPMDKFKSPRTDSQTVVKSIAPLSKPTVIAKPQPLHAAAAEPVVNPQPSLPVLAADMVKMDTAATKIAYNKVNAPGTEPTTLNEVAIVGYGSQKRTVLTSSATVINADQFKKLPDSVTVNKDLTGKIANIVIPQNVNNEVMPKVNSDALPAALSRLNGSLPKQNKVTYQDNTQLEVMPDSRVVAAPANLRGAKKADLAAGAGAISVGNRVAKLTDTIAAQNARPVIGWKSYQDYLTQNAVMPDGTTGEVDVAFSVAADGNLYGFRIISGSNKILNQKAIDMIKTGPKWIGGPLSKEISLKIVFRKKN